MSTLKDIAKKLGISVSTVSKGLSGASDVSIKTRQRILGMAVKIGYVPKQAKSISAPKKICIFIENMGYERVEQFGYDIIIGFKLEAAAKKWDVSIVPLAMNEEAEYDYDEFMVSNNYSAGFLLGFNLHNNFLKQLEKTNIQTVLLDNIVYNKNVACVGVDNREGVFYAVEHLFKLGHKKIAMLNGETVSLVSEERLSGFLSGMKSFGLKPDEELIANGNYASDMADKYVGSFVEKGATAIVCASDLIAHGVMRVLHSMDVSVPQDVSVVGFDDLPLASYTTPALTTIRQNRLEIGRNVCLMIEQMLNGNCISRLLLKPELVKRESTARPGKRAGSKI